MESIPTHHVGTRSSARLQGNSTASDDQISTCSAPISQPAGIKRKRSQNADELEDVRPSKQFKELPTPELSEANLRLFNKNIDASSGSSLPESIKRSSSQRSISTTQATKVSSHTNHYYRNKVLRPCQINIHSPPPPKRIHDAIRAIVDAELPEGRREQLVPIVQEFLASCIENTSASVSENDFVKIFHNAICLMRFKKLSLRTNADWNDQLKPVVLHSRYNMDSLTAEATRHQQQVSNSAPPPPKRHQQATGRPYIPTQPSGVEGSDSLPPPANIPWKVGTIKTPRPDITMGIARRALLAALSSQGLGDLQAELFVTDLQERVEINELYRLQEPLLISVPSQIASDLMFPFGVCEGKGGMTGAQLAAAENQAGGSGACALYNQYRLDELVKRTTAESSRDQQPTDSDGLPAPSNDTPPKLAPPSEAQIPLFFSICTEGPVHMLWVHWIEVELGNRRYNMNPLKCVYGCLEDGLMEFFIMVDNILRWGTGHFLESLVVRLGKVAGGAEKRT